MSSALVEAAAGTLAKSLTVDMHAHGSSIPPNPFGIDSERAFSVSSGSMSSVRRRRPNVSVMMATGDPLGDPQHWDDAWAGITCQLEKFRTEAAQARVSVITDAGALARSCGSAIVLGLEGADVVGDHPECLGDLYRLGVRVVGLVHRMDNGLGTVFKEGAEWSGRGRYRSAGLSLVGGQIIGEMNRLGMLVDLAHADLVTTMAVCERTSAPVLRSHTGAPAQFISDVEVQAIAATGGLIGLWPGYTGGLTVEDLDVFIRHVSYLAELVGPEHLCLGTGLRSVTDRTNGIQETNIFTALAAELLRAGFSAVEVQGILGENGLRVLTTVLAYSEWFDGMR